MPEEKTNTKCESGCGCYGNSHHHHGVFMWVFKILKLIIMISIAVILVKVAVNFGRYDHRFGPEGHKFSQNRPENMYNNIPASPASVIDTSTSSTFKK